MNRVLFSGAAATAITASYITCNEPTHSTNVESRSIKEKDVNDELLKKRRIFLNGRVDEKSSKQILRKISGSHFW